MRDNSFAMRVKTILSIIAFIAAFGLSVLLVGVPQYSFFSKYRSSQNARSARLNIQSLLRQDIDNGYLRTQRIKYLDERAKYSRSEFDIAPYAEATEEYVDASESISLIGLPSDFRSAWLEHMRAWREHAEFLNRQKNSSVKHIVNGREVAQYPFKRADENLYHQQVERINTTWYEVLRIGRKYGAYVSEY
jgi:hypothetical protein